MVGLGPEQVDVQCIPEDFREEPRQQCSPSRIAKPSFSSDADRRAFGERTQVGIELLCRRSGDASLYSYNAAQAA